MKSNLDEILKVERKNGKVFVTKKKGNYFRLIVKENGVFVEIKDFRYEAELDNCVLNY